MFLAVTGGGESEGRLVEVTLTMTGSTGVTGGADYLSERGSL